MRVHARFGFVARAVGVAAAMACVPIAQALEVTLGNNAVGVTPLYIGYNSGHYLNGSNTSAWVEYSGVNAFRIFAPSSVYEPSNPTGLRSGDGIATLSDFDARKASLRSDPEGTTYTDWATYRNKFENTVIPGNNNIRLNYALGELKSLKNTPILQISRGGQTPLATWGDRWEQWHAYYVMAFHAAKNYDVSRFQMFNEPDLPAANGSPQIGPADWLARMKLASDAIRSAILDVDALYNKSLTPDLSGPTGIGREGTYANYGKPAITTNHTDYAGRTVAYDVLNTYDLHRYGTSPNPITSDINYVRDQMAIDSPDGKVLPVTYTEFNSSTTNNYNASSLTPNDPSTFTAVAADLLAGVNKDVKAMYAFKFNQTGYDPGTGVTVPQKTGFYYVDDDNAPNDTRGATLGAETMRLLARAFKGERARLGTTFASPVTNYDSASSFDSATNNYRFVGVNRTGAAQPFTFDVSGWNVAVGSVLSLEEVSARRHGEVTQLFTVPSNRKITLTQAADTVYMLTALGGPASTLRTLRPVADAQVRNDDNLAGGNRATNYGADVYARVGRAADAATGDYVSYLKFDLGATSAATVDRAILQITGETLGGGDVSFHVYAITDDSWTSGGITWNNAPGIAGAPDPRLAGVGTTALPVGSMTFGNGISTTGIDITEYLRAHPDQIYSFALIREEQFAGDAETSYARLATSESATPPALLIFGGTVPEPATFVAALGGVAMIARRRRRR